MSDEEKKVSKLRGMWNMLHTIEVDNALTQMDHFWNYRPILWMIISFVVIFFVWAGSVDISQHILGTGRVIPSGAARYIQHLEGGTVEDILVKEGQEVKKGQPLFVVRNKKIHAQLNELQETIKSLLVKQKRLQSEAEGKGEIDFSEVQERVGQTLVDAEKQLFENRGLELKSKIAGQKDRLKQKVLKLDELETNVRNLRKERAIKQEQLNINAKLKKTGAISRSVYLETKSQVENFNTQVQKLEKEIPITKSEMTEIIKGIEEMGQKFQAESGEELNKVNVDILTTQERINAAKDQVNRTEISSPVNGVVSKVNINTVGGVVKSGDRLAEIIPLDETLVVEGRIATSDRGKIWKGLPVVVRVTAYDYTIYGSLDGTLTYVSANSFSDQNGGEYYLVRVTLDRQSMKGGKHIYPGMVADVHIIAGEMSVLRSLLKPLWYIRDNALRES